MVIELQILGIQWLSNHSAFHSHIRILEGSNWSVNNWVPTKYQTYMLVDTQPWQTSAGPGSALLVDKLTIPRCHVVQDTEDHRWRDAGAGSQATWFVGRNAWKKNLDGKPCCHAGFINSCWWMLMDLKIKYFSCRWFGKHADDSWSAKWQVGRHYNLSQSRIWSFGSQIFMLPKSSYIEDHWRTVGLIYRGNVADNPYIWWL